MQTENLIKISTYAKEIGKSVQWVYKLIAAGDVKSIEIDGVKFIVKK
jgi:hypothetical protein